MHTWRIWEILAVRTIDDNEPRNRWGLKCVLDQGWDGTFEGWLSWVVHEKSPSEDEKYRMVSNGYHIWEFTVQYSCNLTPRDCGHHVDSYRIRWDRPGLTKAMILVEATHLNCFRFLHLSDSYIFLWRNSFLGEVFLVLPNWHLDVVIEIMVDKGQEPGYFVDSAYWGGALSVSR